MGAARVRIAKGCLRSLKFCIIRVGSAVKGGYLEKVRERRNSLRGRMQPRLSGELSIIYHLATEYRIVAENSKGAGEFSTTKRSCQTKKSA